MAERDDEQGTRPAGDPDEVGAVVSTESALIAGVDARDGGGEVPTGDDAAAMAAARVVGASSGAARTKGDAARAEGAPPSDAAHTEDADPATHGINDANLSQKTARAGALTLIAQAITFLSKIATIAVLARYLNDRDYGLYGMVAVLMAFVMVINDLGLEHTLVQRKTLTRRETNALFWLAMAIGVGITALIAALSPLVAYFYQEPELIEVTLALSLTFTLSAAAIVPMGLLGRGLRYGTMHGINVTGVVLGLGGALGAAWAGAGHWALIANELIFWCTRLIGSWWAARWLPSRPVWIGDMRGMLNFGVGITGYRLLQNVARNVQTVLVGRYMSASAVGIYTRASSLYIVPLAAVTTPLSQVALSALSKLQDQPERFRSFYRRGLELLGWITIPAAGLFAVAADEIVLVALGPGWEAVTPIFRMLTLSGAIFPLFLTIPWAVMPLGQTRVLVTWATIAVFVQVPAYALGLLWGLSGVAVAYSLSAWAMSIIGVALIRKRSPVQVGDVVGALRWPVFASTVAAGLSHLVTRVWLPLDGVLSRLALATATGFVICVVFMVVSGAWRIFLETLALVRGRQVS